MALGLDFEAAISSPGEGMITWKSSQQIIISLRRFARTYESQAAQATPTAYNPAKGVALTPEGIRSAMAEEDVGGMLGTEIKGMDMDRSLGGIVKRVALLLAALIGLGVALYAFGLQYMFPEPL